MIINDGNLMGTTGFPPEHRRGVITVSGIAHNPGFQVTTLISIKTGFRLFRPKIIQLLIDNVLG
ncbi:hypothetical protein Y5W_00085 [Alcanivorax sp. 521-1]|uniref:Uncharacterized protein n=1 Tax=Alloalcanivorax profundimaris TaxID=2735259 RepID=A0ABS0AKY5_9GAMM|nr:hypothetical protein [Alloalcanivorax profundimaris]